MREQLIDLGDLVGCVVGVVILVEQGAAGLGSGGDGVICRVFLRRDAAAGLNDEM